MIKIRTTGRRGTLPFGRLSALHFVVRNKCIGCCEVCEETRCEKYGKVSDCEKCKNFQCVNKTNYCPTKKPYECLDCKYFGCIVNPRFDIKFLIKDL